jgi:nitroreductase
MGLVPLGPGHRDLCPCLWAVAAANGRGMTAGARGSGSSAGREPLSRQVTGELLRAATAAPSMHNTQPWRFRVRHHSSTIELWADTARMLPVADPHGRAVHIACGAALFNLRLAAAVADLEACLRLLPDPGRPLILAEVRLGAGHRVTPDERELHAAIAWRQTNREPFSGQAVPPGIRAELAAGAALEDAFLHFLGDGEARRVLCLAADAERDLLADPGYRAELARWAGGERDRDGIPDSALGPASMQGLAPVRDFTLDQRQPPVRYAWFEAHPQLAVLSVRHGGPVEWLRAGQALQRVWLTATLRGIAVCPLTQPLETADAWQVRDPRSGIEEPQMILRIGYGLPLPPGAPRRPASEVLSESEPGHDPPQDHQHP